MPDNTAYMQYVNQIREVLFITMRERGEITNPDGFVSECVTLLQRRWKEVGLTPDVFDPFLKRYVKGQQALAAGAAAGGPLAPRGTAGGTARKKL